MLDLRYVAGIVDGEGCISLAMFHNKQLHIRLKVKMNHLELIQALQSQFGGSLTIENPKGNRKQSYSWQISCGPALEVIKQVQPYLIVKQDQAKLVMMFAKLGHNTNETVNDAFKTLMHKYNKRGVDEPQGEV